jgi:hypothetical protein
MFKGFRVDFGEGIHKGYAVYQHKKDAEKSANRYKMLGKLPIKITETIVERENQFDDPNGSEGSYILNKKKWSVSNVQ